MWISPGSKRFAADHQLVCAQLGGAPTAAAVELWTQNAYFGFQVVQVFLVTTLSSAATSVVTKIVQNPTSAADLLAHNLPRASNFYVSYIVLQGLTFTSGALLNIGGLIIGKVLGKLLDTSPRKLYRRWSSLSGLGWGTVLPPMSLLAVIGMSLISGSRLYLLLLTLERDSHHVLVHCAVGHGIRDDWPLPLLLCFPLQPPLRVERIHRHQGRDLPAGATASAGRLLFVDRVPDWFVRDRNGALAHLAWTDDSHDHLPRLCGVVPRVYE